MGCEIDRDAPLTAFENACAGLGLLAPLIGLLLVGMLFGGCAYKGAKVTEGTDLAVGINLPMTEGTMQLQVLNYLSGFRVGVDRNAIMTIKYTVAETNDYIGCVHTTTYKTADVVVEPCETNGQAQPAGSTATE